MEKKAALEILIEINPINQIEAHNGPDSAWKKVVVDVIKIVPLAFRGILKEEIAIPLAPKPMGEISKFVSYSNILFREAVEREGRVEAWINGPEEGTPQLSAAKLIISHRRNKKAGGSIFLHRPRW